MTSDSEIEQMCELLNPHSVGDLVTQLFYMHKKRPDMFACCRREMFEFLYKTQAEPLNLYLAMVAFKVAKASDFNLVARQFRFYYDNMPQTIEKALDKNQCNCSGPTIDDLKPSDAFIRYCQENPDALECRIYED